MIECVWGPANLHWPPQMVGVRGITGLLGFEARGLIKHPPRCRASLPVDLLRSLSAPLSRFVPLTVS